MTATTPPAVVTVKRKISHTKKLWTQKELKILKDHLKDGLDIEVMAALLPNRTSNAIKRQAIKLDYGSRNGKFYKGLNRRKKTKLTTISKYILLFKKLFKRITTC